MIEYFKQEIIEQGLEPNDFIITENGYAPKWYWEKKQIAKKEDEPIIDDVNVTAETIVYTTQDVMMLADTVIQLMNRVSELEGKLNG